MNVHDSDQESHPFIDLLLALAQPPVFFLTFLGTAVAVAALQ
ncbi:MAG: hypothetical protein ACU0E9_07890 [Limimaricola soesokkakensis]